MPISYSEQATLTCPNCGRAFETTLWLIVDAQERPELAQAIRTGQLDAIACPHCGVHGPTGAPLLYHDAVAKRVIFAPSTGAAEFEVRDQARELMTILVSNIPEEQQGSYLSDVQIAQDIEGVRAALEKDERRRRARAASSGQETQRVPLPTAAASALPAQPLEEELPPLLLGVHALLAANTEAQISQVLAEYPELLASDADQTLGQLAAIATDQREHDVAEALAAARKVLTRLRARDDATPADSANNREETLLDNNRLSEVAYGALMQATSEGELREATRAYPALLEPWADDELAQRVDTALDLGDDHGAQAIEDRREALAALRTTMAGDDSMLAAVRALLSTDEQDDIAVVIDAHPVLLSDAAQEALWELASEARGRGDEHTARVAIEYRALLREVRQGIEE